jgi:predicted lipoprotein with Yx(FWY)xxD motif
VQLVHEQEEAMIDRAGAHKLLARGRFAGLAAAPLAGMALLPAAAPAATKRLTLKAEKVSALHATVLAAPNGRTLYRLKPETSRHLLCTSSTCLRFWHPLTVSSKSTTVKLPRGLRGRARLFKRGRVFQVMLGSDPLYTFAGDTRKGQANGKGIKSFGGTWFLFTVKKDSPASPPASMPGPAMPGPYPY